MSPPPVTEVQIETVVFPPTAKPTGTAKPFFLGGAGERGLEIEGRFVKFTAIGVYLEESAVPSLAVKWKGKSAEELTESVEFFRDIVSGQAEPRVSRTKTTSCILDRNELIPLTLGG
ncbi:chalcone--flavanone isomerase-like [Actinidia eriantha]|uniref:chalcone--flavanone isomerase-like n=1 Tax=Actinidia eriantha TaxID=165200 RepID=UPI00258F71AB|nr:chalcone--flavanone isomerase-like [Actinidia eriantha]